jgi:TPR repeat protein
MQHLTPFHSGSSSGNGTPGGGRMRWLPIAVAVGTLAVAVSLARHTPPLQDADWLARLANSGDTGAQLELGLAYRDGRDGLTADPQTALYWLQRAAHGGNAYAADQLANAYAQGNGTAADPELAQQWWQTAADGGNADTKRHLGQDRPGVLQAVLSLLTGKTLSGQTHAALLARAEAGDTNAQYQVGIRYRDGAAGFPRDEAQATEWLQSAAASGSALAQQTLDQMPGQTPDQAPDQALSAPQSVVQNF